MTEKLDKPMTKRAIKPTMKRTVAGFLALLLLMSSPATMQGFAFPAGTNSDSNTAQAAQGEDILSGELKQYGETAGENIEIGKVENEGITKGEVESGLDAQTNAKTAVDMDAEPVTEADLQEETLAAVLANPVHHCTKNDDCTDFMDPMHFMDYTDYTDFSYIYFGSYPQSEVRDSATIAAIDSAIATSGTAADAGIDVWVNDIKYRRISEDGCNNTNCFNNVENDGYRYFKWERIKWRVIDNNDNGTLFVLADSALDCKCYNDEYVNITWEKSTIRSWLNGSFYQMAFSSDEQSAITQWKVVNEGNPEDGTEGGNDTIDKVYLLPIGEMTNEGYGFCSGSDTWSGSRQMQPSEYAHARGVERDTSTLHEGNCWWWLRSPGGCNKNAATVTDKGYVYSNGDYVNDDFSSPGVAPVLHIDLSSDSWSVEDYENSDEGDGTSTGGNEKPSNPQPEPSQFKYSGTDGNLDWTIDTEGHLDISGTGDYNSARWKYYSDEIKSATVQVTGITSTSYMFDGCSSLSSLDVSGLDTGNVTNMNCMFRGCSNLSSLDVSDFNTGSVTHMEWMFEDCSSLTSLDVSGFDTSNVTSMLGMFSNCSSLTSLDVSGFNTGNVTDMRGMFENCSSLSSLDVSRFNTSNVTNMEGMFLGCGSLSSLDVSEFDTSNATDMSAMFNCCSNLNSLDVRGFNTSNVTDMSAMFEGCSSLSSLDVSGFDTSNATIMSWMFSWCSSLSSLDVSGFDTSNVMYMRNMFSGCSSLSSLDISGFDMSNVGGMDFMFTWCVNLTTLTLPANIRQSVELPCHIYDSVNDEYVESDSFVWLDSNGQTCEYAIKNLPTKMTYKKVLKNQIKPSAGTTLTASKVTSRTDTVPQGATFTVTDSDPTNPTVSFDGVSDKNAKAVTIPKTITYNGVEYKVTTVSPTAFSTKKDNAKFTVTDNRVDSLTVEYKAMSNAKKTKVTVPETTTYKGIKFKVTSVAAKTFKNNKKVKQVSIAGSVTKIGDSTFEGCTSLKSVTLGKGTSTIGKNTFKNCKKLTKITIKSTKLKTVGKNALKGINAKCKIKVPAKQMKKYQKLFMKKGQKNSVKLVK